MSEIIAPRRSRGMTANGIRLWGIIFLALGIAGRSIIQNSILNIGSVTAMELLEAMQTNSQVMVFATLAIVCKAVETCAAPIFAFLLAEGFEHTSNFGKYIARVLGCAVLSELPYNLAMNGKLFDLSEQNPVFGLVVCLIMLFFFRRFGGKSIKNVALKVLFFVSSFLWCRMLKIESGHCLVIIVAMLYMLRNKKNLRGIVGFTSAMVCSLFDLFYMAATMTFIFIHVYNGEQGDRNRLLNYLVYPVLLTAVALTAIFIG